MRHYPYKNWILNTGLLMAIGLLGIFYNATGQNISETQWYFGNSTHHLIFDLNGRDARVESNQATPFGQGGSAVITDQFNGSLLFYSDGVQVFDGEHNQLTSALNGNTNINMPVVTAPNSGTPGQYYLFTNSGASGPDEIQMSVVDANLPGNGDANFPLGEVVSTNGAIGGGLTNPSEGMIVVPQGDGNTFWLISQDRTSFEYRVTEINSGGIGATNTFDFTGNAPGAEAAHFSFNADSSFLAVAPKTANRNVRILDFDPATGALSFNRVMLNTGFDDGSGESVYDVEWSADGDKLFLSRFGGAGSVADLYQIDLADSLLAVH